MENKIHVPNHQTGKNYDFTNENGEFMRCSSDLMGLNEGM
jgi:hypothetical protein